MAGTIVEVEIPAETFILGHTLKTFEAATFEVEQMVVSHQDSLLPFIWVETRNRDDIEQAFADDESVADFQLIGEVETSRLYHLEWVDRIAALIRILVEEKGTVLSAVGKDNTWRLRMLFVDHDAITYTYEHCKEHGIELKVQNVHEFTADHRSQFELSDEQQTTLRLAYDRGYYSIPREIRAEALAEELGVTHQAVSERLRRGHGNLVKHALMNGSGAPAASQPAQKTPDEEPSSDH
ncbi:helix-turn-helix domain-containing protein [Haladaptatus halobius]|uniref:helix-turn-helix domain-containing protein n=1 Tax=Haladaptatus halobius TaxID=2884875 RepID=UPI001D09BE5E|nr:helix-turn-helix domain-containing protein [Haladaptatus halobius]